MPLLVVWLLLLRPPPDPSCPAPSRRRITQSAHVSGKCAFFAKCFVNVSVANFIISWHEGGAKESALQQRSKAEKREKALRKLCKLSSVVAAESEASCGMRHAARGTRPVSPPCVVALHLHSPQIAAG